MRRKNFEISLLLAVSFLFGGIALAHQPRIVASEAINEINNPEISQAFYGELGGGPAVFEIKSGKSFILYVGVLVPDLPEIGKGISARVVREIPERVSEEEIFVLDGINFQWKKFYEEFGGDNYWRGPDEKKKVSAGQYKITVSDPDNLGKYVLVVGEKEAWSLGEVWNTLKILPILKKDFFGKSPLTAFSNYVGLFLLGFLVVLFGIIVLVIFSIKWWGRRKREINRNS